MAIEGFTRRATLAALAALAVPSSWAARGARDLVTTWTEGGTYWAGVIAPAAQGLRVARRIELPSRAHGLHVDAQGQVLLAARRPGDWLLRWSPESGRAQWHWLDEDARLNGHVLPAPDAGTVWTTETDLDSGAGRLGWRDPDTLDTQRDTPTHGQDPHTLMRLPVALGQVPAGALLVANGGIPSQSETGRSHRALERMDASLVALDARDGRLLGLWRLDDPRLSIRHMAWDPVSARVGIALQSAHDDADARERAPLFASWDGARLAAGPEQPGLHGYGGDIAARAGGGFWLSATRAGRVLALDPHGVLQAQWPLKEACALASAGAHSFAGGDADAWLDLPRGSHTAGLKFDNHAVFRPLA